MRMKKFNALLILATFAMAACDSASNENVPSIASSEAPVSSSIEAAVSSSEAPVASSSEAPAVSSSAPASSQFEFDPTAKSAVTVSAADFPAPDQGKYLTNHELTIGGVSFITNDTQRNDGKYKGISTIQMKKADDEGVATSYIENQNPIHAKLKITLIANIYPLYEDGVLVEENHNATVCPTVYAGKTSESVTTKLSGVESGTLENKKPYSVLFDDAINYQYFKIVNESPNAQYVESFIWAND